MRTSNRVRIYRRARLLPLLAVPILFFSTGCASGGVGGGGDLPDSWSREVTVHLENHNWFDMKIYVIDGVRRQRLATLSTGEKKTVRIRPSFLVGALGFNLEATAIGSGETVTTATIKAEAGDEIFWTVENHLPISAHTWLIRSYRPS